MPSSDIQASGSERFTAASSACLIALVLFVVLSYSFCTNGFGIVPDVFYRSHGADPESLVVGRLLQSESSGLTSNTGFLIHHGYTDTYKEFRTGRRPIQMTQTYKGQVGLQGWILSAIDLAMYKAGITAPLRLTLLRVLAAMALAGTLCVWIYLIAMEFGAGAGLTAGLMILFSPWLTVFADNLYWVPVTWFIPVVLTWYWTVYRPDLLLTSPQTFYLLHGAAIVAKAMCGFEYLPAVIGASGAAFLYGVSRMGWDRGTLARILAFGMTAVAAIFLAAAIQLLLLTIHTGSLSGAFGDFVGRVNYRSVGGGQLPPELAASLAVPLKQILITYLYESSALNIPGLRTYTAVEALIVFSAPLVMAILYIDARDRSVRRTLPAFLLVVVSVVASFTWHVVARGHSSIHTFLNYVLWFVPVLIILPAVAVGMFSEAFLNRRAAPLRAIVAVLVLSIGWTIYWSGAVRAGVIASGILKRSNTHVGQKITLRFGERTIEGQFQCDGLDLSHPFFLRLHANSTPGQPDSSDGILKTFAFRSYAISTELNEFRHGTCAFQFANEIPFTRLTIGQFSDGSGSAVDWREDFQNAAAR
ncbi:hypothetical protein JQ544_24320 [Bradyrhizobium diazoefficiens]|nr:hypothetical protein [Bradyrhizobium diazoefficiens]MBR0814676.1 hypothetical protein [Bradyrhizobium diazoefficiens]